LREELQILTRDFLSKMPTGRGMPAENLLMIEREPEHFQRELSEPTVVDWDLS
jgi:hypothetical protein